MCMGWTILPNKSYRFYSQYSFEEIERLLRRHFNYTQKDNGFGVRMFDSEKATCTITGNHFQIIRKGREGRNREKTVAKGQVSSENGMTKLEVTYTSGLLFDFIFVSLWLASTIYFTLAKIIAGLSNGISFKVFGDDPTSLLFLLFGICLLMLIIYMARTNLRQLHNEVLIAVNGFNNL